MASSEKGRSDRQFEGPYSDGDNPIQRFAATLAHELRGPLAPIGNGLRIVKLLAHDQAQIQGTLGMMERQFGQLVGLVDGLLDLGRLGSSNVRLDMNHVELHNVVSDSIEACAAAIDARQHDVAIESSGAGLAVRGDLRRLTQVFTNLLANSIKYTPPGGHIRIALGVEDGMAVVAVRDDGVGISAEELPHVFDLYSQSPAHRDQSEGGLGIGLAIVRSIVRLHGGIVIAKSDGPGRGSTFTVKLPLNMS
jgi:signal transduction histidine kinase